MAKRLSFEEVVTLKTLKKKGQSNGAIAQVLGVTEGAVRYHVRREAAGAADGRAKPRKAAEHRAAIEHWLEQEGAGGSERPANVQALFAWLVEEHGYAGTYKSVLRYVRDRYPKPRLRPYRRVETPAGAQAQVDWGEFTLDIGDGPQKLYAFVLVLSHSRKTVAVWQRRMDQLSWHHAHNEALRRVDGVPAVVRIDNLKTGIVHGAGPWGEVNVSYRAYARSVGFHVDACLPRAPEHKGKVENKVGVLRTLGLTGRSYDSLADLQRATDEALERLSRRRTCAATGKSVESSWRSEIERLRPLPILPDIFDVVVQRKVQRDCTLSFEGRTYSVPFRLADLMVEVRGCPDAVQVLHDGRVVAEHRRGTMERIVIDPAHYEGEGDERVSPPTPLGKMGRRLLAIASAPVEQRPLDLYAALAEAAR